MSTKYSEPVPTTSDRRLIQTLDDDRAGLNARITAARELGNRKVEKAQDSLIAIAQHPNPRLASAARGALDKISQSIIKTTLDERRKTIHLFARDLGVGPRNKGLETLLSNISLPIETQVKAFAIAGHRRFVKGAPHLLRVIAEGDPRLVWAAAYALIELGSRDVTRELIQIAIAQFSEPSHDAAIYTLGFIGDKRAEPILNRIAQDQTRATDHTRSLAIEALPKVSRSRRCFDTIAQALRDPSDEVRTAAQYALRVFEGHSRSRPLRNG